MVTSDFQATTTDDDINVQFWIDIEGIRRRYGSVSPSWAPSSDTGTNRVIREYMTGLPEISGQQAKPLNGSTTPHEFTVELLDVDEELTELFSVHDDTSVNATYLTVAATAAAATITVDDNTVFSYPCDIFVNRETMRATSAGGGAGQINVDRAQYGSIASAHDITDAEGNALVVEVTDKPRYIYTRECVLCENREGLLEADTIKIRGYIDDIEESNPGVYRIHCAGYLNMLSQRIGETLAITYLVKPLTGPPTVQEEGGSAIDADATSWCCLVADSSNFQSTGYFKIDNEIIKYQSIDDTPTPYDVFKFEEIADSYVWMKRKVSVANRGKFTREIFGGAGFHKIVVQEFNGDLSDVQSVEYYYPVLMERHDADVEVQEVIHSDAFTGTDAASVILEILTSTGDGTNGSYDTLPKGWGLGIDSARVDDTTIVNICKTPAIDQIDLAPFCIPGATNAKEWLEENVLRPCLLFWVETPDGKISVEKLYSRNEALELTSPTDCDEDVLVDLPRFRMGKSPMGEFWINMNYSPGEDKFYGKIHVILADGINRYKGTARSFEIKSSTIYDSRIRMGAKSWLSSNFGDLPDLLAGYIGPIFDRFARNPCPIVDCSVPYNRLVDFTIGQTVRLTSTSLPNVKSSDRGLSNAYFQVVEAHPSPSTSTIDLVLWMIGVHDDEHRLLAPSAQCKAPYWDAGTKKVYLEDDTFADGINYTYDVSGFAAGDKIILVTSTYHNLSGVGVPEVCTIDTVNAAAGNCYITLTATPTTVPSLASHYVETAPYDSCVSAQQDTWAYLSDSNDVLGAGNEAPHVRGP